MWSISPLRLLHTTCEDIISLSQMKLFALSLPVSDTLRRDWKCIFKSGCCGSGNEAVICQAAVKREQHNCRTFLWQHVPTCRIPAAFPDCWNSSCVSLPWNRLLPKPWGTSPSPDLPLHIPLVFSSLLSSHATQPLLPPPPSLVAWASSHFLIFQPIPPTCDAPFSVSGHLFIHLGVLRLQIQPSKDNKSDFPSTCSPFSSDFKPWEWHTVLPTILSSHYVLQYFSTVVKLQLLRKKLQITKLISLQ